MLGILITLSIGFGAEESEYPQVLMHSVKLGKRQNFEIELFAFSCLFVNVFCYKFLHCFSALQSHINMWPYKKRYKVHH